MVTMTMMILAATKNPGCRTRKQTVYKSLYGRETVQVDDFITSSRPPETAVLSVLMGG